MRKKVVVGNWKMNKTKQEAVQLTTDVLDMLNNTGSIACDVVFAPPFPFMDSINDLISAKNGMFLAAQDCSKHEKGSFTGEVSAKITQSMGANYIIIGHSERRAFFKEDNATLIEKITRCTAAQLVPIFCCGEEAADRESGKHLEVIEQQISEVLLCFSAQELNNVIIAYEPVWSIGTGNTASPEIAQEMHQFIRSIIEKKFGEEFANNTSILYGGSCNAANSKELFSKPDIDGGLIGGASLVAQDFVSIIRNCAN